MARTRKYDPDTLIAMFRLAAALRKQMLDFGFTDNGGAIHSAERILNILGLRLCYPDLTHINNLRDHPEAPFSEAAHIAYQKGEKVLIEHVSPHRALTRHAIEQIEADVSDSDFKKFVKKHFQLALLTEAETVHLNSLNRSRLEPDRLRKAGIQLAIRSGRLGA